MLVDSHAHLEATDDLERWLIRAKENGVNKIITIGASIETSKKAVEIAEKYSSDQLKIYATCGIHPQDGKSEIDSLGLNQSIETLKEIASSSRVIAIGECGLDYYLGDEKRIKIVNKDKEFQRELFEAQIELARNLKLPLVFHCRNAWDDIFEVLERFQGSTLKQVQGTTLKSGVFHSWTGDWEAAQRALDLGFYISFSGIVTFKKAEDIQAVAGKMPMDRILIETDSPFLAPDPLRGSKNEPKNVKIIAQFLASLRKSPIDRIEEVTAENAGRLFGI